MFVFIIIALISVCLYFKKYLDKVLKMKYDYLIYGGLLIVIIGLCYLNVNYKKMILMNKNEMFQYKYAEYIKNYDNPTLLNMGYLDGGLYTTTGIIPNTRFFEVQNIPYDKFPDNLDDMKYNVENKNIMFILYYTNKDMDYIKENDGYILDNYKLIYDDKYLFEEKEYNAFLFQVKE